MAHISKDCHHFLAGDAMRSSTRYHALDETALLVYPVGMSFLHFFTLNMEKGK